MAWDDDELRKEALMRMAGFGGAETVGADDVDLRTDDQRFADNLKEDKAKGQFYGDRYGGNPVPNNPRGAAGKLYDVLPDAATFQSGLDPLLKRKGLGR